MKCIYCKADDTNVVDSRHVGNNTIKRRRECKNCQRRFNTYEIAEEKNMLVVKKDGSIVNFDKQKLKNGVFRALEKRNYNYDEIMRVVEAVEVEIYDSYSDKISTGDIGDIILKHLLKFDEVAYIRFAAVYNKFNTLDSFIDVITKIKEQKDEY